ncbi:MAG TPA: amidohydrolase family protein [Bacteroidia bacterium]|jgi:imidazolonepropionase-like amidohydrolase|nr:amidohydrolase family protein [Bacteroidia bacterium]
MKKFSFIYFVFLSAFIFAQNNPSAGRTGNHVLLMNGTAHLGNGQVIENSLIAFNNGKLEMVSDAKGIKINPAAYDTIIRIEGKHVYPAIISPNTILGLQEAEAVRPSSDYSETGSINPNIRSLIAYNTDSKILPTVKTNGVLYTQCTPRSGLISGSSSILATDGWNWEDAVLKADDGIHLNFPRSVQKNGWWAEPEPSGKNTKFDEEFAALNLFFTEASAYCRSAAGTFENNLRFEAMRNVFNGTQNLYLHAGTAKDIILAVNFAKKYSINKPVIVGGKDSWKITSFLRENKIPVMLSRIHDLPESPDDDVDITFRTPALLLKDSVLFCLQMEGDMEAMQSRNLPFLAGTAAAYGLTKEQALQTITLNAAKILGIDNLIGSLEVNKVASLVVSDGDLLDMKTNKVVLAYIKGKSVNLVNDQQRLYEKYKTRYGLK